METYLQYIILLLLVLLIIDRFGNKKRAEKPEIKIPKPKNKSSIMGKSKVVIKPIESKKPNSSLESLKKKGTKIIPKEALDDVFNTANTQTTIVNEWELIDEEEELKNNFSAKTDEDFNTGLSFEELQKISRLLAQKELTPEALPVAVKIADTEVLDILNEQIPQAQERISELLNKHLAIYNPLKTTEDWRDFDIGEFV